MIININDNKCMMCGESKELTEHHAIPVSLKPINNVKVVLCRTCHSKIHIEEPNHLIGYSRTLTGNMKGMIKRLESISEKMVKMNENKTKN